jgi:hypothetical protein
MASKLELIVAAPLADFVRALAVYCEPACCSLNAFDVNAYEMLWWLRRAGPEKGAEALQQLDVLIAQVSVHDGPVANSDDFCFCHEWTDAATCANDLKEWRDELAQALSFFPEGGLSPEVRLAEAKQRGEPHSYLEVRRLGRDAHRFLSIDEERALQLYSLLARLDENDRSISSDVVYARKVLAERGGYRKI